MIRRYSTSPRPLDRDVAEVVAQTMQALATPSRLLILDRLRSSPLPVSELAEAVGMEQSAISHQLRLLRHLGLVVAERRGRQVFYALHDAHVGDLLDEAVGHVDHLRLGTHTHTVVEAAS
jgi:DNA-binding transcriptional ArsR family regulator